jgi:ABC-type lipoprotein export system ATPase subunit
MDIKLKNIAPHPLHGAFSETGELWEKEFTLTGKSFVHILAPSGSGKTTFVSLIYGLRKDFDGTLLFGEADTSDFNNDNWSDIRASGISVVFQDLQLLEELSALENIILKNQLTNKFSLDEIEGMANRLGVFHRLNKKVNTLSRGEKQRIAIVRALCMPFNWIVLDEPFSHLDDENTIKAINLIQEVVADNDAGLIMVNLRADMHFNYKSKIKMA